MSLRKFIIGKRLELLEDINYYKTRVMNGDNTEDTKLKLAVAEGQLEIIKTITENCDNRKRY